MASRLQDVLLRGLAAAKPAATAVANGTLYYSTDTATTEQSNGTTWVTYADGGGSGGGGPHAVTHQVAGGDVVDVKLLGGYPGGTANFLRADGTFAAPPVTTIPTRYGSITMTIDGNGSVITTGIKGFLPIPFPCTILEWILISTDAATLAGSIIIDIWKRNISVSYPPTVADTITASAKPTLSAVNKNQSATLTGWTTSIAANDILGWNVSSVSTLTKATLTLKIQMV